MGKLFGYIAAVAIMFGLLHLGAWVFNFVFQALLSVPTILAIIVLFIGLTITVVKVSVAE